MKLYHSTASPNSRRVRMFLAEKGISIPLQPVNLAEKEQFSDRFKAINPRHQAPVLVLDDFSAADITGVVTVDFATAALKMPIPEDARALRRWYETVAARPSAGA